MNFINIDNYGELNIDKIFFESYFPIIFTCKNLKGQLFLTVCCKNNREGCKWLIARTESNAIVKLLKDEITVREVLLQSQEKFSVNYDGTYTINQSGEDFDEDSIYLPKKDSYMYAEEGEFDEEIAYYTSASLIAYDKENYKSIVEILGTISKEVIPLAEALNSLPNSIGKISINGSIMNTLIEQGNLYASSVSKISNDEIHKEYKPILNTSLVAGEELLRLNLDNKNLADAA